MGAFPVRRVVQSAASGDFNGDASGTTKGGTTIPTAEIQPGTLSCRFNLTATTASLTIIGKWQVSDDDSTWYDLHPENGAALVALVDQTGTADDDVAVACPASIMGWKYVRPAVENGGATGGASDTYGMTSRYARRQVFGS